MNVITFYVLFEHVPEEYLMYTKENSDGQINYFRAMIILKITHMQRLNKINAEELFLYFISAVWCVYIVFYLIFAFLK